MNNRLLLGVAVEMSNAVLKKNRLLSFCHGNLSVSSKPRHNAGKRQFMFIAYCASEKKKSTIDWNCCTWLKPPTSKYLVIAKYDKFGALSQLCCLGYFVVFVTVFDSC